MFTDPQMFLWYCDPALVSACSLDWVCPSWLGILWEWSSIPLQSERSRERGDSRNFAILYRYNVATLLFHDVNHSQWCWLTFKMHWLSFLNLLLAHTQERLEPADNPRALSLALVSCGRFRPEWEMLPIASELHKRGVTNGVYARWEGQPWIYLCLLFHNKGMYSPKTELSTAFHRQHSKSWALVCMCGCGCGCVSLLLSRLSGFRLEIFSPLQFIALGISGSSVVDRYPPLPIHSLPWATEDQVAGRAKPDSCSTGSLMAIPWGLAGIRQTPGQCFAFYSPHNNASFPSLTKGFSSSETKYILWVNETRRKHLSFLWRFWEELSCPLNI